MAMNREINVSVNVDGQSFAIAEDQLDRLTACVNRLADAFTRLELCAEHSLRAVCKAGNLIGGANGN